MIPLGYAYTPGRPIGEFLTKSCPKALQARDWAGG